MTRLNRSLLWAAVILAMAWADPATGDTILAGAAKRELPVALGKPLDRAVLAGSRASTEIHDPVWARALYVEQGGLTFALVTLDLFRVTPALRQRILSLAPSEIPRENIVVTSTLIANGPGGASKLTGPRAGSGAFHRDVLDNLARTAARVLDEAATRKRRATMGHESVRQEVLSRSVLGEDAPTDPYIGAIRVDDADGVPIALLGRFSALPRTTPAGAESAYSADFVGPYYAELEALAAEGCVAFFLNGASGDQRCGNPEDAEGWAWPETVGRLLAVRVKEAANAIRCTEVPLGLRHLTRPSPATLAHAYIPDRSTSHRLTIGELRLYFVPAMPTVAVANDIMGIDGEQAPPGRWLVSGANGNLGVIGRLTELAHLRGPDPFPLIGVEGSAWLDAICEDLDSGAPPNEDDGPAAAPPAEPVPQDTDSAAVAWLELTGGPQHRGTQWADHVGGRLHEASEAAMGRALPESPEAGLWAWTPSAVDRRAVFAPELLQASRASLRGFPADLAPHYRAAAEHAGLQFDALWMAEAYADRNRPPVTLAAAPGPEDADGVSRPYLLAMTSGSAPLPCTIARVRPEEGLAYIALGHAPGFGANFGMNEAGFGAGVAVAPGGAGGPAVRAVLHTLLQQAATIAEGEALLDTVPATAGATFVLIDREATAPRVLRGGETWSPVEDVALPYILNGEETGSVDSLEDTVPHPGAWLYRRARAGDLAPPDSPPAGAGTRATMESTPVAAVCMPALGRYGVAVDNGAEGLHLTAGRFERDDP